MQKAKTWQNTTNQDKAKSQLSFLQFHGVGSARWSHSAWKLQKPLELLLVFRKMSMNLPTTFLRAF